MPSGHVQKVQQALPREKGLYSARAEVRRFSRGNVSFLPVQSITPISRLLRRGHHYSVREVGLIPFSSRKCKRTMVVGADSPTCALLEIPVDIGRLARLSSRLPTSSLGGTSIEFFLVAEPTEPSAAEGLDPESDSNASTASWQGEITGLGPGDGRVALNDDLRRCKNRFQITPAELSWSS